MNTTLNSDVKRAAALASRLDDALADAWRELLFDACGCRRSQRLLIARAKLKFVARLCHDAGVCLERPVVRQAAIEATAERTYRRLRRNGRGATVITGEG
jgi:hypothetical protein